MQIKLNNGHTKVPNWFFDQLMAIVSPLASSMFLIILRQTYGWVDKSQIGFRKKRDWIAYAQFSKKLNKQNQALLRASRELEDRGIIEIGDDKGNLIPRDKRQGKRLYYRIKIPLDKPTTNINGNHQGNIGENHFLKITNTKENYTKNTKNTISSKEGNPSGASNPQPQSTPISPTLSANSIEYQNFISKAVEFRKKREEAKLEQRKRFVDKWNATHLNPEEWISI